MFIYLEDLFSLWGALHFWIINLLYALFTTVDYLLHLLLGDESAVVSKSVVSKVFAAVIPYMLLFVVYSNLFVPELQYLILSIFLRECRASHWIIRAVIRATGYLPAPILFVTMVHIHVAIVRRIRAGAIWGHLTWAQ